MKILNFKVNKAAIVGHYQRNRVQHTPSHCDVDFVESQRRVRT